MINPSSRPPRARRAALVLLVGSLAVAAYFLYNRTLTAFFAYDDMDHLNLAADVLAGKLGFWKFVFWLHHEHLIPLLRLLFLANLELFGVNAFPIRLIVLLSHVGTAVLLGLTARRYEPSNSAAFAAGLAYVVPAGFSSMWIWFPCSAGVVLGTFGIAAAIAAVAHRSTLGIRHARILAGTASVFAVLCENSVAPLLVCPALLDEYERRREGRISPVGPLSVFLVGCAAAFVILSSGLYAQRTGQHFSFELQRGFPRAVFMLAVAPFRYFFPGLPLAYPGEPPRNAAIAGTLLGAVVAGAVAIVFLALRKSRPAPLATVAALMSVGPAGMVALVALRRSDLTYSELYDADRYFSALLVPACLLVGFLVAEFWAVRAGWTRGARGASALVLAGWLGAELLAHRSTLMRRFPRFVADEHGRRFEQLERLAARLNEAARSLPPRRAPLTVPDGEILFPDVHNGRISTRLLLYGVDRARPRLLRLGAPEPDGERLLNAALESWQRDLGDRALDLSVENGVLVNGHAISKVDFGIGPFDTAVVDGFYAWEGAIRWMGRRGELRLIMRSPTLSAFLSAPMNEIRSARPEWDALEVRVSLVEERSGYVSPLDPIRVLDNELREYRLDATPLWKRIGNAQPVLVRFECDRVWRPVDVMPGSSDTRELTVAFSRVGLID